MVSESDDQREERARRLAFEQGQREASVDAMLSSHEKRLNAINGSIDRGVRRTEQLTTAVDDLADQLRSLREGQATKQAVEEALHQEVRQANQEVRAARETQISGKMLWVATGSIVLTILGLILTVLVATHSFA